MNEQPETSPHRILGQERSRSVLWVGLAVVTSIAATSLYIGQAGEKKEDAATQSAEASPAPASSEVQQTKSKSMSDSEFRQKLTPEQYRVTRENGTEPPFRNEYWDNHQPGIYVDLISGEALFASGDKFESGTGWPSFTKPIDKSHIVEKTDQTLFMSRTEVRSAEGDAHLGHVFDDGPAPSGLRYCVNSAALRFIPREKMQEEGYGQYLPLVEGPEKK